MNKAPTISVAFRFHVNFYHSYRGDTPDELGFGKDIRIIRHIIHTLDHLNQEGIDVCGTWDCENYFSLEKIMPVHCPDIIASLKRRVDRGRDEVQIMSYNNGMVNAHTAKEFEDAIAKAITNSAGSGVRDIFGNWGRMVRPQEMMYTPIHLKLYPFYGINAISLFYSAVPFNAFSNFVPPLTFEERYNPIELAYPGIEETMILIPTYNTGDLVDYVSLRHWIKKLRRRQLAMDDPKDLLLLVDMDADDDFWIGFDVPVLQRCFSSLNGLRGLVENVSDLDYVDFVTPQTYLDTHPCVGSVQIMQDTADGSFDGMSSWAEKWSNHQLWTGIERSRILELQTRRLIEMKGSDPVRDRALALLSRSRRERLKSLSTTHFGLSTPIMNKSRLRKGAEIIKNAVSFAASAFDMVSERLAVENQDLLVMDYTRGVSTKALQYDPKPSRGLVKIPLMRSGPDADSVSLLDAAGSRVPCAVRPVDGGQAGEAALMFVAHMAPEEKKKYRILPGGSEEKPVEIDKPVCVSGKGLQNEYLALHFDGQNHLAGLSYSGKGWAHGTLLNSAVTYAGKRYDVRQWTETASKVSGQGLIGIKKMQAEIVFDASRGNRVMVEREFVLAAGLPYLYVNLRVIYPDTPAQKFKKERAVRLEKEWDGNWQEVMPCEIVPSLVGRPKFPLRIWKYNYFGHLSCYDLNYADHTKNKEVDAFNNHVTNGWVAVSDGQKGLLVGQTADALCAPAFCPMRLKTCKGGSQIMMNPFGSYYGRQLRYGTAYTGLGKIAALMVSDSLDPLAPSYNGRTQQFSLLLAPYLGNKPPEGVQNDALAFSYPYLIFARTNLVGKPAHREWACPVL